MRVADIQVEYLEDQDYDTILSEDIDFKGHLEFEKSFLVRGKLEGSVEAHGILLIDTNAIVKAGLKADVIIIRGSVEGDISASRKLHITSTGRLFGDLQSPEIQMEAGCTFNGQCRMGKVEN